MDKKSFKVGIILFGIFCVIAVMPSIWIIGYATG
jgi:hypothetical protein